MSFLNNKSVVLLRITTADLSGKIGLDWRNVEHIRLAHTIIGHADSPAKYESE